MAADLFGAEAPRVVSEAMKRDHLRKEILWLRSLKNPAPHIPERIRVLAAVYRDYCLPDGSEPENG
jgi:hypothetical protein